MKHPWTISLTLTAAAAALAVGAGLSSPVSAVAGTYEVVQCDRANRDYADARFDRVNGGDYGFLYRCEEDEDANALQIRPITGSPKGRHGRISWHAPTGARIAAVEAEARLRDDAGHEARLAWIGEDGSEAGRIAGGSDDATGFRDFRREPGAAGRPGFAAILGCEDRSGCPASERAKTWIRSVHLTIADVRPPAVLPGGSLSSGGWHRGGGTLGVVASDEGSGVRAVELRVNGSSLAPTRTVPCEVIPGTAKVRRLRPCPPAYAAQAAADTTRPPFADGANELRVCARDYGGDAVPACVTRTVNVDNAPPELAFADRTSAADPELITAVVADRHSGVAGWSISYRPVDGGAWRELPTRLVAGRLRARVDSSAEPAGDYVFRAVAADRAGNLALTTSRADGGEMVLTFPLRERTRLGASVAGRSRATVPYGARPRLDAVLRDAGGDPVAGADVEISERFAPGSSLAPAGRTATTDANGRIRVRLSRGPSRTVAIRWPGSRRYLAAEAEPVSVSVRGRADMAPVPKRVRAGRRVVFRGSIGSYGAALPKGKLVELQVRGSGIGRFRTVGRAFRTDRRGRWRMRYRFDRFYAEPARFRFRLRVARERRWPYLAPALSPPRSLIVKPRR
ncbi:MAG: Ig-like domain-containing protein [Solirubrobacterales bacterium]